MPSTLLFSHSLTVGHLNSRWLLHFDVYFHQVTMMSRTILHLKKRARAPSLGRHDGAANIILSRDQFSSNTPTRMRGRSLSNPKFISGGATTISRLPPLPTNYSEQNSRIGAESGDNIVMDIIRTRCWDERTSDYLELHESHGKIGNTPRKWDKEPFDSYLPS